MARKKKRNYINNEDFCAAMTEYREKCIEAKKNEKEKPVLSNYIGECFYQIANGLSHKPNFIGYSYRDEMVADGIENAVHCAFNFDPEKSKNPFSYFTQVIYFAFLRRIDKEKKQMYIKHKVLENSFITDTIMVRKEGDTAGSADYVDLNNEYMSHFVDDYEERMRKKREAVKLRQETK